MRITELAQHIKQIDSFKRYGKIKRVVGLMIESKGPVSSIGDVCYIQCFCLTLVFLGCRLILQYSQAKHCNILPKQLHAQTE